MNIFNHHKKLLIIGGTGFFGKSFIDSFTKGQLDTFCIEKIIIAARGIESFASKYPELIHEKVELVKLDISNCMSLPEADFVIHAASSTDIRDYEINGDKERNNIELAVSNYVKLAPNFHAHSKIVYCSSGAVYGQQPAEVESMDEDFPFQDVNSMPPNKRDYTLGKRFAEQEFQKLAEQGLNVSIARCFAFEGKYLPRDQHFAYGNFLGAAEKGEPIVVKANHLVYRSYMSADDLVTALLTIANNANIDCPVFNVGSDEAIELHDLAAKFAKMYKLPLESAPITTSQIDRYIPNTSKLKSLFTL